MLSDNANATLTLMLPRENQRKIAHAADYRTLSHMTSYKKIAERPVADYWHSHDPRLIDQGVS